MGEVSLHQVWTRREERQSLKVVKVSLSDVNPSSLTQFQFELTSTGEVSNRNGLVYAADAACFAVV